MRKRHLVCYKSRFHWRIVFTFVVLLLGLAFVECHKEFSYTILSTWPCPVEIFENKTCPFSEKAENSMSFRCGFTNLCEKGLYPKCISVGDGSRYICSEDLTNACPPGKYRRTWIDKQLLKAAEEDCPEDTYQRTSSGCYGACGSKHKPIEYVPQEFMIYVRGNTTTPTLIYCDYKHGYFNTYNKTFLDYDNELQHNPYFCTHINQTNPCGGTLYPLPNGTCVLPCQAGFERDDHMEFMCLPRTENRNASLSGEKQKSEGDTTTPDNHKVDEGGDPEHVNPGLNKTGGNIDGEETMDSSIVRDVIVVCSVVGVVLVGGIVFLILKRRNRNKEDAERQGQTIGGSSGERKTLLDPQNEQSASSIEESSSSVTTADDEAFPTGNNAQYKKKKDDTIVEEFLPVIHKAIKSTGATIYKGNRIGTCFVINGRCVWTCLHVVKFIVTVPGTDNINPMLMDGERDNLFVTFESSVCIPAAQHRVSLLKWSEEADFAILRITSQDEIPPPLSLCKLPFDKLNTDHVIVIGYGHPKNHYKKCFEKCQVFDKNSPRIKKMLDNFEKNKTLYERAIRKTDGDVSAVTRGYKGYDSENIIIIDMFMEHGVSGGPVIYMNSESPIVVGYVVGGRPEFFFELPPGLKDTFDHECRFEIAGKMESIYKKIVEEDRDLANMLFPKTEGRTTVTLPIASDMA